MNPIDDSERAAMQGLLMEQKRLEGVLSEADDDIALWSTRVKLATQHGEEALAQECRTRLARAEAAAAEARLQLEHLQNEKDILRHGAHRPEGTQTDQAEALLENFRAMGVHPEEQELKEITREQEAGDMLAALKARMNSPKD